MTAAFSPDANSQPPKLLDQVRVLGFEAGHSVEAVRSIVDWNRRFF